MSHLAACTLAHQSWAAQSDKRVCLTAARTAGPAQQGSSWQLRQRRQQRQRCSSRVQASPDPMRSPLFESEIFQQEMNDMFRQLMELTSMYRKFGDFDTEGKKIYLTQMESLVEKLQLSVARVRLVADDPFGKEMLRMQAVQMLNANTNLELMVAGVQQVIADMRRVIALEESTADPVVLARIKQEWQEQARAVGSMDFTSISTDPLVQAGAQDPQALKAANEVMQDPGAIDKYRDNPALYEFLRKTVLGQR